MEKCSDLIKKYAPPDNCALLEPPKLNLEVSSAIRESVFRRDKKIVELQNQIGSTLSALGQVLSSLLKDADSEQNVAYIKMISKASKLLLDFHHKESKSRRELISPDLKIEAQETLSNVQVDSWLFGKKLGERIKASKEVQEKIRSLPSKKKSCIKQMYLLVSPCII